MRDWNSTAWIKSLVLLFFFLICFFSVPEVQSHITIRGIARNATAFFIGLVIIPLILRFFRRNKKAEIEKPYWNANAYFSGNFLMIFLHFAGYFAIAVSLGSLAGSIVKYRQINPEEFTGIFLGAGILLGIWRINKK